MQKKILNTAYAELYPDGETNKGKNLLIKEVALTIIRSQLRADKQIVQSGQTLTVLENESEKKGFFMATGSTNIHLAGKIDRIDLLNGRKRLIDYKTGVVHRLTLLGKGDKIADDIDFSTLNNQQFQLLFYLVLDETANGFSSATPLLLPQAGIYGLRSNNPVVSYLNFSNSQPEVNQEVLTKFKSYLSDLFKGLYNPEIPFEQTTEKKRCQFCSYVDLCNQFSPQIYEQDETNSFSTDYTGTSDSN